MDGVRLVSMQTMDVFAHDEFLPGLIVPGELFDAGKDAFVDTAAVMQNLDLIIPRDTSIAHRTVAPCRPVWPGLCVPPDWLPAPILDGRSIGCSDG